MLLVQLLLAVSALAAPRPRSRQVGRLARRQEAPGPITIPSPVEHTGDTSACKGYRLTDSSPSDKGLDGVLELIGKCNAYGPDYQRLKLSVRYENRDRLRVRIVDEEGKAHTVPSDVASWPSIGDAEVSESDSALKFTYTSDPFTFSVTRKADGEVLFDTAGQPLIFEEQYVRVASALADGSHIQGIGQHNDNFTLPITEPDYVRTLWTRDAYGVPSRTNLYGAHPFYVNQKVGDGASASGTFLLNSHGMDVKFPEGGKNIEFNVLGGIVDLFFFNGPTPADVVRQGAAVWGTSDMVPYWGLGFHSCKYGYEDIAEVAEVVANYTAAKIPLQTQWMDIDYMYSRWINTLDPDRFELQKVRYVVDKLHESGRDLVVMVDPAVFSGTPNMSASDYETLQSGLTADVFLKMTDGKLYEGVVWPGPTAFPDWTHPNAQDWWTSEFARFFDKETGVDVSGIWLDMNEPANFLPYLEANIYRVSAERGMPPVRPVPRIIPRDIPGFDIFVAGKNISDAVGANRRRSDTPLVLRQDGGIGRATPQDTLDDYLSPELDNKWLYPPYRINDRRAPPSGAGADTGTKNISDFSARTDLVQANGGRTYDEHNLYGSRHAIVTHNALAARTPGKRPFTIARSSFSGTPSSLWLGDNYANWEQYIQTIRQMLQFTAIAGVGVVGADSCGFGGNTTETLCARWAWLGAFNTFYRNHNELGSRPQEFYRWPITASAARAAGHTRLALLDYTYTTLQTHSRDGTPVMWPLSWVHPSEAETVTNEAQFYYGPNLLVSPVTQENATSVDIYLPNDLYYDFFTLEKVQGHGSVIHLEDVGYDTMPLHIRGGAVVPLRKGESFTTGENRNLPFELVVAPGSDGCAFGCLYLDDGESVDVGNAFSDIKFKYDGSSLHISGSFGYDDATLDSVVVAGVDGERKACVGDREVESTYDADKGTLTISGLNAKFCEMSISLSSK